MKEEGNEYRDPISYFGFVERFKKEHGRSPTEDECLKYDEEVDRKYEEWITNFRKVHGREPTIQELIQTAKAYE